MSFVISPIDLYNFKIDCSILSEFIEIISFAISVLESARRVISLNPEDAIYRTIIQSGHGFKDEGQPPLYLHTTEEMMEEFSYLGQDKAYEVVVTNTNKIADMIEHISPIHPDKCPPVIENSDEELQTMCYETARKIYGESIPEQVTSRLEKDIGETLKTVCIAAAGRVLRTVNTHVDMEFDGALTDAENIADLGIGLFFQQ